MLGSLDQILGMLPIPGLTKEMREMIAHGGEGQFKRIEVMTQSMTKEEKQNPEKINASRIARISKGSGVPEAEIQQFLKQFEQMKMIMKQFTKMGDEMKKEASPSTGLRMPRSMKKKNKAKMPGMPKGFPNLPPGAMPPGGFPDMDKLPGGFPFGGGKFPFGK